MTVGTGKAESAEKLAQAVFCAFKEVSHSIPSVVAGFVDAFNERRNDTSLMEADPDRLTRALAGLLIRIPPQYPRSSLARAERTIPADFEKSMKMALDLLAARNERVLRLMRRNQEASGRSLPDFLASLLQLYSQNKTALPY